MLEDKNMKKIMSEIQEDIVGKTEKVLGFMAKNNYKNEIAELILSSCMLTCTRGASEALEGSLRRLEKEGIGTGDAAEEFIMECVEINTETANLMMKRIKHHSWFKYLSIKAKMMEATNGTTS